MTRAATFDLGPTRVLFSGHAYAYTTTANGTRHFRKKWSGSRDEPALRYALGSGADVLVCGMNSEEHVDQAAAAFAKGAASEEERAEILRSAPEFGEYVWLQCDGCPASLKHLFRLEGCSDRQMIDYLPHDPANYALRLRLSGWFDLKDYAREQYLKAGWHKDDLVSAARDVACPYGIDVARKTRLTVAKSTGEDTNTV